MKPEDKQRFPREWALFEQNRGDEVVGFRIEEWPILSKGQVMTLKAVNVHTVEQVAALGDQALGNLGMGFRKLQKQAQALLEHASGTAVTEKLAAENEELKQEMQRIKDLLLAQGKDDKPKGKKKKQEKKHETTTGDSTA
jgi:hypothetical protein